MRRAVLPPPPPIVLGEPPWGSCRPEQGSRLRPGTSPGEKTKTDGQTEPQGSHGGITTCLFFSQVAYDQEKFFPRVLINPSHSFDKPLKEKRK